MYQHSTLPTNEWQGASSKDDTLFTPKQWGIFFGLILLGLLLRWIGLDERPLHHDESLHVMYGKYFYDNPLTGYYRYDPMLHGPLLYSTVMFVYNSLGVNQWAARFPVALMGSVFLFLPFLFRRYFSRSMMLCLTGAVAVSPSLVYWSRFLREDYFVMSGVFLSLYGVFVARPERKAFWFFIGLALQLCSKESIYVHFALVVGYFLYEFLFQGFFLREWKSSFSSALRNIVRYYPQFIFAVFLFAFVTCFLYTGAFQYWKGIWDVITGEPIRYWLHQHGIERIRGPFLFHFYVLSWYESLFVLLAIVHAVLFYRSAHPALRIMAGGVLVLSIIAWWQSRGLTEEALKANAIWGFFNAKDALDVLSIPILLFHPVLVTSGHLLKRQRSLAVSGYAFTSLFFTYSYLGEKVPWLSMYPFIAGLVYFASYFDAYFEEHPIADYRATPVSIILTLFGASLVVLTLLFCLQDGWSGNITLMGLGAGLTIIGFLGFLVPFYGRVNLVTFAAVVSLLFTLRASLLTNFVYNGEPSEYISQVHTTRQFQTLAHTIRAEIESEKRGYRPHVYVEGDPVWPLTWYFRDLPEYKWDSNSTPQEREDFLYKFKTWVDGTPAPAGYRIQKITLRGWWVPDFSQMTLKKFLAYALNHRPWNGVGYSYAQFLTRLSEEPGK